MAINPTMAKINTDALTKAMGKSESFAKPISGENSFKDMLTNMQMDYGLDKTGVGSNAVDMTSNMQALDANEVAFDPSTDVSSVNGPDSSSKVVGLLAEANKGYMQMDNLVSQVMYGSKKYSNQELLAIQAHVYNLNQIIECTVKVVEHAVGSTRQVLNTSVQ